MYKRGQGRGAIGAEGWGVGRKCPLSTSPLGKGFGRGPAPPKKKISNLDLKMATLGAFWTLFFTVHGGAEMWGCGEVF